jgi:hypothetical protein
VDEGFIADYVISVLPFIPELSDLCEVRVDFANENFMRNAEKVFSKTPFVLGITPILGLHSLSVRIYIPRQEVTNLMTFISALARDEVLVGYSYIFLDRATQITQTFAYKTYTDETGWHYDNRDYLQAVNGLVSKWSKLEAGQPSIKTSTVPID